MKRIKKRLLSLTLGLVLSLGVGTSIGASQEATPVKAEDTETVTYFHKMTAAPTVNRINKLSRISWVVTGDNIGNMNTDNYAGVQFGASNYKGSITFTSSYLWGQEEGTSYYGYSSIKSMRIWLNQGGGNTTLSVAIGGKEATTVGTVTKNSSAKNDYSKASCITVTPDEKGKSGIVEITANSTKAGYFCAMEIVAEKPVPVVEATSLTVEPSSITTYVGESVSFTPSLSGGFGEYEETIEWTSSDANIAEAPENCEAGEKVTISAKSTGTVTLTGKVIAPGSAEGSIEITVEEARKETNIALHGTITKKEYYVGDDWDLSGLDLEITWNKGDATYVDFDSDKVVYEFQNPETALDTSITSFEIYTLYEVVDGTTLEKTFHINGISVVERPIEDKLSVASTSLNITSGSYTSVSDVKKSATTTDINSNATWAGVALKASNPNEGAMQLNKDKGALYTTASSDQIVSQVSVDFKDAGEFSLQFYGSNTPFTNIIGERVIGNETLIATLDKTTSVSSVSGSYKYVYIYSTGATCSNSITVRWENADFEGEAEAWGKSFMEGTTTATCEDINADNSEDLIYSWSLFEAQYNKISDGAKEIVKKATANNNGSTYLEKAVARYDHIITRYGSKLGVNANFIGREIKSTSGTHNILASADNGLTIAIIVIVSLVSVSSIGATIVIRKRKTN